MKHAFLALVMSAGFAAGAEKPAEALRPPRAMPANISHDVDASLRRGKAERKPVAVILYDPAIPGTKRTMSRNENELHYFFTVPEVSRTMRDGIILVLTPTTALGAKPHLAEFSDTGHVTVLFFARDGSPAGKIVLEARQDAELAALRQIAPLLK